MTFEEFWDWLQFESPDREVHAQALAILRYTTPTAQEEYVKRFYNLTPPPDAESGTVSQTDFPRQRDVGMGTTATHNGRMGP